MGRPAGTPNKRKAHMIAKIREIWPEYHPVIEMVKIGMDMENPVELRASMHKEVAQYVEPKRKAMEVSTDGPIEMSISWCMGED